MKKILSVIMVLVLLCGLLTISATAAGTGSLEMTSATGKPGETVTLSVKMNSNPGLVTMEIQVSYDTTVLQLTNVSDTGLLKGSALNPTYKSPYQITWIDDKATDNNTATGTIATFTFKILDGATAGDSKVTLEFLSSADTAFSENNFTATSGKVTVKVDCAHEYKYEKLNANQHEQICSKCGDKKEENHSWNEGVGTPSCTQNYTMKYTCTKCGEEKTENVNAAGHKYDSTCDPECNICGAKNENVKHTFATTWSKDNEGHWHECKCGEKADFAPHTASSDGKTCTVCKMKLPKVEDHVHNMETEWTYDNLNHWHRCTWKNPSCYEVTDWAAHDYDDDCDVNCNTCGAVRTAPHNYLPEWQANAEGHWQVCADCNAKAEFEHIPGPEATETEPQTCTECGFLIKMPTSHVHNYGETWYSDNNTHWQSCNECAESTPMEPHMWNEGVTQDDGKILYTCSVCMMELTLDEPMSSEPETTPTTQPVAPGEDKDSGGFPWQWAGIAAVVLMLIGIILLVIEFIRSRKTNMHGKFSK